jgi:hypothetical protein
VGILPPIHSIHTQPTYACSALPQTTSATAALPSLPVCLPSLPSLPTPFLPKLVFSTAVRAHLACVTGSGSIWPQQWQSGPLSPQARRVLLELTQSHQYLLEFSSTCPLIGLGNFLCAWTPHTVITQLLQSLLLVLPIQTTSLWLWVPNKQGPAR